MDEKAKIREAIRATLGRIEPAERGVASAQAAKRLTGQSIWSSARTILFYSPLEPELDLSPLMSEALSAGKRVALPAFERPIGVYTARLVQNPTAGLQRGHFGILEPGPDCPEIPRKQLDLILVPGVAFALNGHRICRGGGYYDRLLAETPGVKCGIAFDEQIQDEIAAEPHDVVMDFVVTPTRWIVAPRRST